MRNEFTGKSTQEKNDLSQMESYLGWSLEPIRPRKEFVDHLRGRLVISQSNNKKQVNTIEYIIFGAAGLIGSLILLIASVRAGLAIIEAIKYLRHSRNALDRTDKISLIQ